MGITRTWRVEAPSSYSLKLVGLSEVKTEIVPYESAVFTASGYQWRLILYPLGNDKDGGKNHVSVYLRLETSVSDLPKSWEIHVDMKFFVFDQNQKKYLTVQDGIVKRYNEAKKELGIAQFMELSVLKDQKNGYVVKDTCIFGVEIVILKPAEKLETVTFLHNPPNGKFKWKILHFSNANDQKYITSDQFLTGQRYWKLSVEPKKGGEWVGLYLVPQSRLPNSVIASSYATFNLRIRNQLNANHISYGYSYFFSTGGYGTDKLIRQKDLYDQSKGFLVKDAIILEVEMLCVSQTQVISN